MARSEVASIDEVALGAFFEDIGKFMQPAFGSSRTMAAAVKSRESDVLPPDGHGGYSHKHALLTDAFFEWMERRNLAFPHGIDSNHVRECAVYHHSPRTPLHWLSAIADRLSAGMDREAGDEVEERKQDDKGWDAFRRVPLESVFRNVNLALGTPKDSFYGVEALTPTAMFPGKINRTGLPDAYARLWEAFGEAFASLCDVSVSVEQFHEGLLALSERFTWAIPSSTVDQPDVSLHDHNRTVAAFAACLYRHHEAHGELGDEKAIKDRERAKFRVVVGDLSGIQSSLFRLKSEGVKGVNRILRARSFLISQICEAAAWKCRRVFGLPPYCLLQGAGGRFQILVPELADVEATVEGLRREIDKWMLDRYVGDLVMSLALSPPLSGADFNQKTFGETQQRIAACVEEAKQRPLASILANSGRGLEESVRRVDFPAAGACPTCGVRPVPADAKGDTQDDIKRCPACADEARWGQTLPKAVAVTWGTEESIGSLLGSVALTVHDRAFEVHTDLNARRAVISGWRLRGREGHGSFPAADRFLANHVPTLQRDDDVHGRYADLSKEAKEVSEEGKVKLLEHLAADAREWLDSQQRFVGRAMLSVVKADVDRLGFVFGHGLGDRISVGRAAQLSRMIDSFFTGYLDHLIRTEFRNTYTVYAGGDDVLLIAPWRDGIRLAARLQDDFGRFVGHNPNITLSAGIEFVSPDEPLNRAVRRAEDRLKRAKADDGLEGAKKVGRNRVCLVVEDPIPWTGGVGSLEWAIERAEWLNGLIREGSLPATFLYKMLSLDSQRREVESGRNPAAANWRARWGYHLARLRERLGAATAQALCADLDELMGGNLSSMSPAAESRRVADLPDPRLPITIAIYRNR
ncbi:MAG: type III-A CRISPR-associated protein Cas10/Csm1 [Rhodospirillales bacterium]|nr:type III-A CRISPR-associated protein Cas10/Csm1 [Rhodospirillales bacterium]